MNSQNFPRFGDAVHTIDVAGLTVEYQGPRIALYGQTEICADRQGLERAEALKAWLESVIGALREHPDLPDQISRHTSSITVVNPFE